MNESPQQKDAERDHLAAAGTELAFEFFQRGDFVEASRCFSSATTLGARLNATELTVFAMALCRTGDHEGARAACDLAAELLAEYPEQASSVRKLLFEANRMLENARRDDERISVNLYTLRSSQQASVP